MGLQWIWRVECNGFGDGLDGINAMDLEVMDIVTKNQNKCFDEYYGFSSILSTSRMKFLIPLHARYVSVVVVVSLGFGLDASFPFFDISTIPDAFGCAPD